jgi:hypothetical protein
MDASGQPCPDKDLQLSLMTLKERYWNMTCRTDGDGRFRFVRTCAEAPAEAEVGGGCRSDDVPEYVVTFACGPIGDVDLGDLQLDGRTFLSRLDDDAAERLLRKWVREGASCEYFEPLLIDLLQRPKERWIPVLEQLQVLASDSSSMSLPLLTTLRRMQGRPDPVQVELLFRDAVVVEWPGDVVLRARAINVDAEGAKFTVSSGDWDRWLVQVVDRAGTPLPAGGRPVTVIGGAPNVVVSQHEALEGSVDMLEHVDPLVPGEYRVRVFYHGSNAWGWPQMRDWLSVSASREIPLTVVPRRIETSRDEQARLAAAFEGRNALDVRTRAFDLLSSTTGAEVGFSIGSVSSDQVGKWREWRSMLEIEVR